MRRPGRKRSIWFSGLLVLFFCGAQVGATMHRFDHASGPHDQVCGACVLGKHFEDGSSVGAVATLAADRLPASIPLMVAQAPPCLQSHPPSQRAPPASTSSAT